MAILSFPPFETASPEGILAVGGDLDVDSLLLAYKNGIFPWPIDERLLTWFAPPKRAITWLKDFHIPKSLKKERRRPGWSFTVDRNFAEVIHSCAELKNRRAQAGTWITKDIIRAYLELHRYGYAHSIECYYENNLVGGLYGVAIGGMFAGESMFYRRPNASKLALCFLVDKLRAKGVEWFDCQVMTPLLKRFGAIEVERDQFMKLLKKAVQQEITLFS